MLSRLKNFWSLFSGVEKKLLLLFILILLASAATLLVQNQRGRVEIPKIGGGYSEGLVGQPQNLNPLLAPANDVDLDLSRIVYAGLLKFDNRLNLVPDLAQNLPEVSPDGKEYTIKLKEGLFWHDGLSLTADDLVFTFQAVQNPDLRSPLRRSWTKVEVEKLDHLTVKLKIRESSTTFIANLTLGILPKHIWETVPAEAFALSKFNLEPVGAGPFRVAEIKRGRGGEIRSLLLRAFERYSGEGPYLRTLTFKFYETTDELINAYHAREIMGLGYVPFDQSLFIQPKASLQQIFLPLPQYQAVFINRVKNPAPLEDRRVRLALAKAVDKKKIIDEIYVGQGSEAYGPIPEGYLGYHPEIPGADMNLFDISRAKALLDEAGWMLDPASGFRQDKLGRTLALNLATNNNYPPNVLAAQALKKMWEGIGIQISLNIETLADLEEKFIRPRNYELLLYIENVGADPDPYPYWHSSQLRDPGLNFSTFSNKTADRLLLEARTNLPATERAQKYRQFQEIFVGDVPAIFLTRSVFVYNLPQSLKGAELNTVLVPAERFADINLWYVETKRVRK